jgi:hypothetical protein
MPEPEVPELCKICWDHGTVARRAYVTFAGIPMCDDHATLVCVRCERQWYTRYDQLCDGCRTLVEAEQQRKKQYDEHLNSNQWRQTKKTARRLNFVENGRVACSNCGLTELENKQTYGEGFHGHHKTYERFGHELPEDVQLLCSKCHAWLSGRPAPKNVHITSGWLAPRIRK